MANDNTPVPVTNNNENAAPKINPDPNPGVADDKLPVQETQKDEKKNEKKKDSTQWNLADIARALSKVSGDMTILGVAIKGVTTTAKGIASINTSALDAAATKLETTTKSIETVMKTVEMTQKTLEMILDSGSIGRWSAIAPGFLKYRFRNIMGSFVDIYGVVLDSIYNDFLPSIIAHKSSLPEMEMIFGKIATIGDDLQKIINSMLTIGQIKITDAARAWVNSNLLVGGKGQSGSMGIVGNYFLMLECIQSFTPDGLEEKLTKNLAYTELINKMVKSMCVAMGLIVATAPIIMLGGVLLLGPKWDGKRGLIGILGGFAEYVSRHEALLKDANKNALYLSAAISILAGTVLAVIGIGMLLLNPIAWASIAQMGAVMGGLIVSFMLLGLATRWIKEGTKTLLYIATAVSILGATAALIALTGQFIAMSWQSFLIVGSMILLLTGSFLLLSLSSRWINEGCLEMLYIASAVAILGLTAALMVVIANNVTENWDGMRMVFRMLLGLTGVFVLLALASNFVNKGAWMMLVLLIPMAALIGTIWALSEIVIRTDMKLLWSGYGVMMAILGGFATFVVGLTAFPLLAVGIGLLGLLTVQIGVVAGSMLMMAKVIEKMSKLSNGDEQEMKDKALLPINTFVEVVKTLAGDGLKLRHYKRAAKRSKQLAKIAKRVGRMAETLAEVASLNYAIEFDENGRPTKYIQLNKTALENAKTNVSIVVSTMIDAVTAATESESFKDINKKMKKRFKRLNTITKSVAGMVESIKGAAGLSVADAWDDETGKPIHFRSMTKEDFSLASDNISKIMSTMLTALSDPNLARQLNMMSKKAAKNLVTITSVGGNVGDIVKTVSEMSNGKIAIEYDENGKPTKYISIDSINQEQVGKNLTEIVSCYVNAIGTKKIKKASSRARLAAKNLAKVTEPVSQIVSTTMNLSKEITNIDSIYASDGKTSKLSIILSTYSKAIYDNLANIKGDVVQNAKAFEKTANSTVKLVTAIDKADLNKLTKAYGIMDKLASFSKDIKGNFDGLAKAINDELVDAIEKLQEVLEKISEKEFNIPAPQSIAPTITNVGKSEPNKETANLRSQNAAQARELTELRKKEKKVNDLIRKIADCVDNGSIKVITQ